MNKQDIILTAEKTLPKFIKTLEGEEYQLRGILNSEALLLIALTEAFGVSLVVESGRARGYSTYLLAKYFQSEHPNLRLISIDLDDSSEDAKYSEQKLGPFKNVSLVYGNANEVIKDQVNEPCIVFIDGPKGDAAIKLSAELLQDERVQAVLVHDLHRGIFARDIAELVFVDSFFTDDESFVERFKHVDANCWKVMASNGYKPYLRKGEPSESYGHTLAVFFNNESPVRLSVYKRYQAYLASKRTPLTQQLVGRMKSAIWLHYRRFVRTPRSD
jgi:predicted O-methyltransferase YrrM